MTPLFDLARVGETDVSVSRVAFGCSGLAGMNTPVSADQAQGVLQAAWDAGLRYFDTAPHYGRGQSEARLGAFLADQPRADYAVSTKVGRVLRPGPAIDFADGFCNPLPNTVHYDYSAAGFAESLAGSRARLGIDYIDVVFVHDIGALTHGADNARHMDDLMNSGLPYLERLKSEGKIGAYGLGVNEVEICIDILTRHPIDVILLAGRWTLLDRRAEDGLVDLCRQKGTTFVLGGVFNSGILATGPVAGAWFDYAPAPADILARATDLQNRCAAHDVELSHAALQFAATRPQTSAVLIGTAKVSSLSRNLAALRQPLDATVQADLLR